MQCSRQKKSGISLCHSIAERIEEDIHQMKWRTIIEVATILPEEECTAAVEAARTICCLARTGCICFDVDGHVIEDYNQNKTMKRNDMRADFEG